MTASISLHQEVISNAALFTIHESWNATMNRTDRHLTESGESISAGLAKRLAHYARHRLTDMGWGNAIAPCTVEVDAWSSYGTRPEDQNYVVKFINDQGGEMGVQGIQIRKGWPVLDHGVYLQ